MPCPHERPGHQVLELSPTPARPPAQLASVFFQPSDYLLSVQEIAKDSLRPSYTAGCTGQQGICLWLAIPPVFERKIMTGTLKTIFGK